MDKNLIPKENKAQIEEVREMESEIPSLTEFEQTYRENKQISESYEAEEETKAEIISYGPGNEQSKEVAQKIGSLALATSYFTPVGAITAPLTLAAGVAGGGMYAVGEATGDDSLKEAGKFIAGTAVDAGVEGLGAGTLNAGAPVVAKVTKEACKAWSEVSDLNDKAQAFNGRGVYIPMDLTPQERAQLATYAVKHLI